MFTRLRTLSLTDKKLTLRFVTHTFVVRHHPSNIYLTSMSFDNVPRPLPFFTAVLLPCIILNVNQGPNNGGGLGTRLLTTSFTIKDACCLVLQSTPNHLGTYNFQHHMWGRVWDTVDCRLQSDCSIDIQMFCEAFSDLSFFACKGP